MHVCMPQIINLQRKDVVFMCDNCNQLEFGRKKCCFS